MAALFEELQVLQSAEKLADDVWHEVTQWDRFARDTVGKQFVRATDSIGANVAEAFGRYHYGEKLQFLYYARGSAFETKYWLNRVNKRSLLTEDKAQRYLISITLLTRQLNSFLAYIKQEQGTRKAPKPKAIRENPVEYIIDNGDEDLFTSEEIAWLQDL